MSVARSVVGGVVRSMIRGLTSPKGVGAAAYAPYAAPAGYRWDFVTEGGATVTERNIPVVELQRVA